MSHTKANLGTINYLTLAKKIQANEFSDQELRSNISILNKVVQNTGKDVSVGRHVIEAMGKINFDIDSQKMDNLVNRKLGDYAKIIEQFNDLIGDTLSHGTAIQLSLGQDRKNQWVFSSKNKEIEEILNSQRARTLNSMITSFLGLGSQLSEGIFNRKPRSQVVKVDIPISVDDPDILKKITRLYNLKGKDISYIGIVDPKDIGPVKNDVFPKIFPMLSKKQFVVLVCKIIGLESEVIESRKQLKEFKSKLSSIANSYEKYKLNYSNLAKFYKNKILVNREQREEFDLEVSAAMSSATSTYKFTYLEVFMNGEIKINLPDFDMSDETPGRKGINFTYIHFPGYSVSSVYDNIIKVIINKASGNMSIGATGIDPEDKVTINEIRRYEIYQQRQLRYELKKRVALNILAENYEQEIDPASWQKIIQKRKQARVKPVIPAADQNAKKKMQKGKIKPVKQKTYKAADIGGVDSLVWASALPIATTPNMTKLPYTRKSGPDRLNGSGSHHGGIDIAVEKGTDVYCVGDGFIHIAEDDNVTSGGGITVEVLHDGGKYKTTYEHLESIDQRIMDKKGKRISAGTKIGKSGNTGKTTGPHLHFSVKQVDGGKDISNKYFDKHKDKFVKKD